MESPRTYRRRCLLRAAGAAVTLGVATAGCLGGDESDEFVDDEPAYDGWFEDVDAYEGTVDRRGETSVTVRVGAGPDGLQFDPPAAMVDHLTTVVWEWTGDGGAHSVVHRPAVDDEDPVFESDLVDDGGHEFEYTFNHEMIYPYYCESHRSEGMKGAVVVEH